MDVPQLESLPISSGTRVLVRCDLNVPVNDDGLITDTMRLWGAEPTLRWLLAQGAAVICCSHFGRPKGGPDPRYSLAPVATGLSRILKVDVPLAPTVVGDEVTAMAAALQPGEMMLLENLRFHPGETKGDPELGAALAALADCFVMDAFGAAHRAHASVVGPPEHIPSAAGRLVVKEVEALSKLLDNPAHPFVGVLGGAKVSDKLGVIEALLEKCDRLLIGGAMANTFLAAQNLDVGDSLVEDDFLDAAHHWLATGRIAVPTDVVVAPEMSADAETREVLVDEVPPGWKIFDIGPATRRAYAQEIMLAATACWNGPMGVFELGPFSRGTTYVAEAMADCGGYTVVGGGDSAAAMNETGMQKAISHMSTGGGATLEFLEHGDLPGLEALRKGRTS